jgi:hypothetical protein
MKVCLFNTVFILILKPFTLWNPGSFQHLREPSSVTNTSFVKQRQ